MNKTYDITLPNIIKDNKTFLPLRKWQEEAFNQIKCEKYSLIQAATGSGKSTLIVMTANSKLIVNPKLRAIIAVPYKNIGFSFDKDFNHIVDGKEVSVKIEKNIACNDADDLGKIQALYEFLQKT